MKHQFHHDSRRTKHFVIVCETMDNVVIVVAHQLHTSCTPVAHCITPRNITAHHTMLVVLCVRQRAAADEFYPTAHGILSCACF
jgi:hypothetical protein